MPDINKLLNDYNGTNIRQKDANILLKDLEIIMKLNNCDTYAINPFDLIELEEITSKKILWELHIRYNNNMLSNSEKNKYNKLYEKVQNRIDWE